jgi:hypothetical protein
VQDKFKIIIIVLIVLLAASLFIVFAVQNSRMKLMQSYDSFRQKALQENKQLADKLSALLADNQALQERLEAIQGELEQIALERDQALEGLQLARKETEELSKGTRPSEASSSQLASLRQENERLKLIIDGLEDDRLALRSELIKLRQDKQGFRQRIEQAKYILREKALIAGAMSSRGPALKQEAVLAQEPAVVTDEIPLAAGPGQARSIDLPLIVVSSSGSSDKGMVTSLEGRILKVNKEYDFVVIDLGRQTGASEGMAFDVFRQGEDEPLGRIEAIQVRSQISACDILQVDRPFKIGDIVRY